MSLVLKNGVSIGSANISVLIGGVIVTGIKSIDFKFTHNKENVMGFPKEPVARGRQGKEYGPITMEILLEEYKSIVNAAPNRDVTQIAMFNIPIVYDGNAVKPETLTNVEFTSVGRTYSAGDGALWVSLEAIYAGISQ